MQQLELNQPKSHDLEFHISRYLKNAELARRRMSTRHKVVEEFRNYEENGHTLEGAISYIKGGANYLEKERQALLIDEVRYDSPLRKKIRSYWIAKGIADSFIDQHDSGRRLSEKQINCLYKMIDEARGKNSKTPSVGTLPNIVGVYEVFNRNTALKYPKIWLKLPDGTDIKISRLGSLSKYEGQLSMANGTYGDGMYFGRITKEGDIHLLKDGIDRKDEILTLLNELADNPEEVATKYGRLTGNCCFCVRQLSDERSLEVGYGETCASHYNLPWGESV